MCSESQNIWFYSIYAQQVNPDFQCKELKMFFLEDTKRLTRNCKAKTEKQCNDQQKNDKMTNHDLQYSTQKTKGRMRNMNGNDKH